jgi:hypothetical protein
VRRLVRLQKNSVRTLVPTLRTGAPYLARFSRDVGYHCSFPLTLDSSETLSGQHRGIPYLAKNERDMGHPSFAWEQTYDAEFLGGFSRRVVPQLVVNAKEGSVRR